MALQADTMSIRLHFSDPVNMVTIASPSPTDSLHGSVACTAIHCTASGGGANPNSSSCRYSSHRTSPLAGGALRTGVEAKTSMVTTTQVSSWRSATTGMGAIRNPEIASDSAGSPNGNDESMESCSVPCLLSSSSCGHGLAGRPSTGIRHDCSDLCSRMLHGSNSSSSTKVVLPVHDPRHSASATFIACSEAAVTAAMVDAATPFHAAAASVHAVDAAPVTTLDGSVSKHDSTFLPSSHRSTEGRSDKSLFHHSHQHNPGSASVRSGSPSSEQQPLSPAITPAEINEGAGPEGSTQARPSITPVSDGPTPPLPCSAYIAGRSSPQRIPGVVADTRSPASGPMDAHVQGVVKPVWTPQEMAPSCGSPAQARARAHFKASLDAAFAAAHRRPSLSIQLPGSPSTASPSPHTSLHRSSPSIHPSSPSSLQLSSPSLHPSSLSLPSSSSSSPSKLCGRQAGGVNGSASIAGNQQQGCETMMEDRPLAMRRGGNGTTISPPVRRGNLTGRINVPQGYRRQHHWQPQRRSSKPPPHDLEAIASTLQAIMALLQRANSQVLQAGGGGLQNGSEAVTRSMLAAQAGNTAMAVSPVALPSPNPAEGKLINSDARVLFRDSTEDAAAFGATSLTCPAEQSASSAVMTGGAASGLQLAQVACSFALQVAEEHLAKLQPAQRHLGATSASGAVQDIVQKAVAAVARDAAFLLALSAQSATQAKLVEISDAFEKREGCEDEVGRKRKPAGRAGGMMPTSNGSMADVASRKLAMAVTMAEIERKARTTTREAFRNAYQRHLKRLLAEQFQQQQEQQGQQQRKRQHHQQRKQEKEQEHECLEQVQLQWLRQQQQRQEWQEHLRQELIMSFERRLTLAGEPPSAAEASFSSTATPATVAAASPDSVAAADGTPTRSLQAGARQSGCGNMAAHGLTDVNAQNDLDRTTSFCKWLNDHQPIDADGQAGKRRKSSSVSTSSLVFHAQPDLLMRVTELPTSEAPIVLPHNRSTIKNEAVDSPNKLMLFGKALEIVISP